MTRGARMWGKWKDSRPSYPLIGHLIDTACFAEALCDLWLPRVAAERASDLLGVDATKAIVAGAALHDIGKCNPVFQGQLLSPNRAASGIASWFDGTGLSGPPDRIPDTGDERAFIRRHETASAVLLAPGQRRPGTDGTAAVVAGHHGQWRIPDRTDRMGESAQFYDWLLKAPDWVAGHLTVFETVMDVCGLQVPDTFRSVEAVPVLTGVVVIADWLASQLADDRTGNGPHHGPLDGSWHEHRDATTEVARDRVAAWLGSPAQPAGGFAGAFPFIVAPRPVQSALTGSGPVGLRIVAVPTGDGKTEAALGRWLTAADGRGLFFGLPTMATADAMFARVAEMFNGTEVLAALAHGRSTLNEFYDPAPQESFSPSVGHDTCAVGMHPSEWLVGSRRAMLAPITIGTVDQILLGVVRHRFGFLRLLGAVGKTVVLDEVHSYDPYMSRVLERFLEWAGRWHIDVVLLSATLPGELVRRYAAAYGGDAHGVTVAYPSVTTVAAGTGATATVTLPTSGRDRTLDLEYHVTADVPATTVDLVTTLRRQHPDAKIGVIVNTVGHCQSIASKLVSDSSGSMMVLHSRFTAARRAGDTAKAVARFGKHSRSGGDVLIATQVAEQSMDLDFDVLVTELCPAPSLVQRPGRLHRHDLNDPARTRDRPAGLRTPTMIVVVPDEVAAPNPKPWPFLPYTGGQIVRTWDRGLHGGQLRHLTVPDDVQAFVDRSHLPLEELGNLTAPGHALTHLLEEAAQRAVASDRLVPSPDDARDDRPAKTLTDWCVGPESVRPSARLIDDRTVSVILHGSTSDTSLPAVPGRDDVRDLLGRTVPCPARWLNDAMTSGAAAIVQSWDTTSLSDVVVVDTARTSVVRMDPLLGLVRQEDPQ